VRGKGGFEASVPIHPDIARLADQMPAAGFWFTSYLDPTQPVSPKAVSLTIKNALLAIGCTARPHQLRDSYGTKLQRVGKDLRVTQQMLRHRSVRSTQKYTGVSDDAMRAAILALDWHHAA
jgi:site-specific recombinase XerD